MTHFNLDGYNISHPEKIIWRFPPCTNEEELFTLIRSKSLKKFLKKADKLLANHGVTFLYQTLDRQQFLKWLPYYRQKMLENHYDIIASEEWYDDRISKGRTIEGLFFYSQEKLVGSGIFVREKNEKSTFAFKASDRDVIASDGDNASFGAIIDFFFLRQMVQQAIPIISAGRSRNAFGVVNSLGYLDYKLRFGYLPQPDPTSQNAPVVPLDDEGIVVFFGTKEDEKKRMLFCMFAVQPKNSVKQFEVERFASPNLPFEVITY